MKSYAISYKRNQHNLSRYIPHGKLNAAKCYKNILHEISNPRIH